MRERKTVWDQMDRLHQAKGLVLEDEGFLVGEYAERYRMSCAGAYTRLQRLVRDGALLIGWSRRNGRRVRVYRFPEG